VAKLNQGAIQMSDYHCIVYSQSASTYYLLYRHPLTKENALKHLGTDGYVIPTWGTSADPKPQPTRVSRSEDEAEVTVKDVDLVRIFQTWKDKQDLYVQLSLLTGEDTQEIGKTQTKRDCELNTTWNESFVLHNFSGCLKIVVMKANNFFQDVICGEAYLNLEKAKEQLSSSQSAAEHQIDLFKKGSEKTGSLRIKIRLMPKKQEKAPQVTAPYEIQREARRLQTQVEDKQSLRLLLNRPTELDKLVHRIFRKKTEGGKPGLGIEDMEDLMQTLALELGRPLNSLTSLQNLEDLFWKYNAKGLSTRELIGSFF
jgi:hypothetical protein